jgi:hypothetical protein
LPHVPQNRNAGWSGAPQDAQVAADGEGGARSGSPQSKQNVKLGSFSR